MAVARCSHFAATRSSLLGSYLQPFAAGGGHVQMQIDLEQAVRAIPGAATIKRSVAASRRPLRLRCLPSRYSHPPLKGPRPGEASTSRRLRFSGLPHVSDSRSDSSTTNLAESKQPMRWNESPLFLPPSSTTAFAAKNPVLLSACLAAS